MNNQAKLINDLLNLADENQLIADLTGDNARRAASVAKAKECRDEADELGGHAHQVKHDDGERSHQQNQPESDYEKRDLFHFFRKTRRH